jgi:hypothetical protein
MHKSITNIQENGCSKSEFSVVKKIYDIKFDLYNCCILIHKKSQVDYLYFM